ncbi:hypothetical protein [Flagellimonas myxillae]|uniref:hypothetical protein n=1 Tax=Flagellimonas myxillae TaxID=2942214 RepID=UPI00201F3ACA|nr:hypothetical protein [Muricauda myxillae]MCL6265700.1 hypothetical protein [Muricauda myxillae]
MPYQKRSNLIFPLAGIRTFVAAEGLDEFIRTLEKDFFAEVTVKCRYKRENEGTELILDINCNFGLTESLHHFNTEDWGGVACNSSGNSSFDNAFARLREINDGNVDITELSIHFRDTSLVISKVQDYSIPEQLGAIINKISEHFVYFTKGLTEMPYEIFVPVFEEDPKIGTTKNDPNQSFFDHWGLYFEDDPQLDAMVYSLESKTMEKEDFFLLD